jgi:hypothetical protein
MAIARCITVMGSASTRANQVASILVSVFNCVSSRATAWG